MRWGSEGGRGIISSGSVQGVMASPLLSSYPGFLSLFRSSFLSFEFSSTLWSAASFSAFNFLIFSPSFRSSILLSTVVSKHTHWFRAQVKHSSSFIPRYSSSASSISSVSSPFASRQSLQLLFSLIASLYRSSLLILSQSFLITDQSLALR